MLSLPPAHHHTSEHSIDLNSYLFFFYRKYFHSYASWLPKPLPAHSNAIQITRRQCKRVHILIRKYFECAPGFFPRKVFAKPNIIKIITQFVIQFPPSDSVLPNLTARSLYVFLPSVRRNQNSKIVRLIKLLRMFSIEKKLS